MRGTMARQALFTLVALVATSQLSWTLQVTPNSPCSSLCLDSAGLDTSDPNSSTTTNDDITCQDAAFSSAAGSKFKTCMTCLQTSTFSQGSESDVKWFLYNLRYTASYCLFGFPNATDIASTPCTIDAACGNLQASVRHGILDPSSTTAFSYCEAGGGEALDFANFETCVPCLAAGETTDYLANYFVALEAGCRQQPAPGVLLGLNDTIFSETQIGIVDPTTLLKDETPKEGLAIPVIVGIVAGGAVFLLIVAGVTFVCLRKRKNKRARASAQSDFYTRFNNRPQHRSSMSFQCQTHMVSPRFWPDAAAQESMPTPIASPDTQADQSSIWKTSNPSQHTDNTAAHITKKAAMAAVPLHHLTTTVAPHPPPQAYTSPSSSERAYHSPSDFRSPLSAESARSTSALLPSIKPYVPAEHGVHTTQHGNPPPPSPSFSSPVSATATAVPVTGTGMTPLLTSRGWPLPEQTPAPAPVSQQHAQQHTQQSRMNPKPTSRTGEPTTSHVRDHVPPLPPPLKTSRTSGLLAVGRKSPRLAGSPVESREIQTSAFAAPPRR